MLVEVIQVTSGRQLLTKKHRKDAPVVMGEATFSKTGKTCYWNGLTLEKNSGGGWGGGTHTCVETGDQYIVMKKE